jgi:hypothetical protein
MTLRALDEHLGHIEEIRGSLILRDNAFLSAVNFFARLRSVESIEIINMPNLLEARLPSLRHIGTGAHVEGCPRLCPARYPSTAFRTDYSGCPALSVELYTALTGLVGDEQIGLYAALVLRATEDNLTNIVSFSYCLI